MADKYRQWTCTARREGRECGGHLGDVWDGELMVGGREVVQGVIRCPICRRTHTWHRRRKAKVDNNMRGAVQYQGN